jgi:hypothetical protein
MNKLSLSIVLSVAGGLMLLTMVPACDKLVEVPANSIGSLVTSQVFSDSASATQGVLGLYASAALTNENMDRYPGLSGDELLTTGTSPSQLAFQNDSLYAGNAVNASPAGSIWTSFYRFDAIYQANAAIEALNADNNPGISAAVKNQLIGECEVVRAFCYFYLVNLFGPVPLTTTSSYQANMGLPRSPVDSVYGQIERDLLDAKTRLVPSYPSPGRQRPNLYTADALLSRVYLYRQQWAAAEALADSVLQSGVYSLVPALKSVFLDKSREAIWQLGSNTPSTPNAAPGGSPFLPSFSFIAPGYTLSSFLLASFEPGDQRSSNWVQHATVINFSSGAATDYAYPWKYKNSGATLNPYGTQEDLMLLRLGEIYLVRAEARARQGNLGGAMQDVNTIRNRAGLGAVSAAGLSDALGAILHERQTELFCEWGHRWLDLKRMDSVNAVLSREKPAFWPADGHAALYPVPFGEIQLDRFLTQNPGY